MKVDIKNVEKVHGGMFSKRTLHGVALTVVFTEEEKAIIEERKLQNDVILDREPSADVDVAKLANKSMLGKVAQLALKGSDSFTFNLTIAKLLKGTDTHFFQTPLEAKQYTEELKEKLPEFKNYIMANAEAGKDDSFEL